jgi:hypothetical protein
MSEFDTKAAEWVRTHYPGALPVEGTVEFEICAGWDGEAFVELNWTQGEAEPNWTPGTWAYLAGATVSQPLTQDLTQAMREIMEGSP